MSLVQPNITEEELRELLVEAELPAGDAEVARLLPVVQPMRARLRASGAKQRRAMLRGAAMTVNIALPAHGYHGGAPVRPPVPEAPAPRAGATLGRRLGALLGAVYTGFFAMMSLMGPWRWLTVLLAVLAVVFVLAAVTGRGLSTPAPPSRSANPGFFGYLGIIALVFIGAPLLLAGLALVVTPSEWGDAGAVEITLALVALLAAGMIGSHLVRTWRRDG